MTHLQALSAPLGAAMLTHLPPRQVEFAIGCLMLLVILLNLSRQRRSSLISQDDQQKLRYVLYQQLSAITRLSAPIWYPCQFARFSKLDKKCRLDTCACGESPQLLQFQNACALSCAAAGVTQQTAQCETVQHSRLPVTLQEMLA